MRFLFSGLLEDLALQSIGMEKVVKHFKQTTWDQLLSLHEGLSFKNVTGSSHTTLTQSRLRLFTPTLSVIATGNITPAPTTAAGQLSAGGHTVSVRHGTVAGVTIPAL